MDLCYERACLLSNEPVGGAMVIQTSTSENEQDGATRRELQHAVLLYLAENGSAKWGALYSQFY